MKGKKRIFGFTALIIFGSMVMAQMVLAADPIVIGVPTSIGFLEGKEGLKAVEMAVEEINAAGGLLEQLRFFAENVNWFAGVPNTRIFPHSAICQVFDSSIGPEAERGTAWDTLLMIGSVTSLGAVSASSGLAGWLVQGAIALAARLGI